MFPLKFYPDFWLQIPRCANIDLIKKEAKKKHSGAGLDTGGSETHELLVVVVVVAVVAGGSPRK